MAKNLATVRIVNSVGAVNNTILYDLTVFNYLVMRLDTDQAWAMKEKFNDVLIERETNSMRCLPQDYETALEALLAKHWKTTFRAFQMTASSVWRISAVLKKSPLPSDCCRVVYHLEMTDFDSYISEQFTSWDSTSRTTKKKIQEFLVKAK